MNVYTYFEPLGLNDAEPLTPLWLEHWKRAGFEPVVLGPNDLFNEYNEQAFREFDARVSTYPTVNPPSYERACYIRWFAFHTRLMDYHRDGRRALMVDLDVFPNGIKPDEFFDGKNTFFDPSWVPCAVASSWFGSGLLLDLLTEGPVVVKEGGRDHCSDMIVFQQRAWKFAKKVPRCMEYGGGPRESYWSPSASMLHFKYSSTGPNKAEAVKKFFS